MSDSKHKTGDWYYSKPMEPNRWNRWLISAKPLGTPVAEVETEELAQLIAKAPLLPEAIEALKAMQYESNGVGVPDTCRNCGAKAYDPCSDTCEVGNVIAKYEEKK